jgi:hypothetical protein
MLFSNRNRSLFINGLLILCAGWLLEFKAMAFQAVLPNANPTQPNNSDTVPNGTLVSTFVDRTGQPYGRYIVNETMQVVAYEFQPVKEKVFVPKTVTENKTTVQVQYVPVYSYQPQLRNVYTWNPFASPQQVWENVPVVQYQTNYVQVNQPFTYQKYEEQELTKMVPVLVPQARQVPKMVDRPLGTSSNGGNMMAANPQPNTIASAANSNLYQQTALASQANRNVSNFPTRPIDYYTGTSPYAGANPYAGNYAMAANASNAFAQAPAAYYLPANATAIGSPTNPANGYNAMAANNIQPTRTVLPTVPVTPNGYANTNGNPAMAYAGSPYGSNPYGSTPYGAYPYGTTQPYNNMAARPTFSLANLTALQGSLFGSSFVNSQSTPTYMASNTAAGQPYASGNGMSGSEFRPTTNPYASTNYSANPNGTNPYMAPQNTWGVTPTNTYRDPIQGGMQATELR